MKKTKQKILKSAVKLFNEEGLFAVRNQDIASAAGMSLSNFNYHFKNKDELVDAVIAYLLKGAEERVYLNSKNIVNGAGFGILISYLKFQYEFRFFYLDSFSILKTYPKIKKDLVERISIVFTILKNICYMNIGKGIIKPVSNDEILDQLVYNLWRNNHYLLQSMNIWDDESDYIKKGIHSTAFLISPYLTEEGLAIIKELKSSIPQKFVI